MPPVLEVRGIEKRFPGVRALDGVSLHLERGEVLAVVGENGAGKSTLMKVLAGIEQPDAGTIRLDGREVRIGSTRAATLLGIALIHQELNLADNLDAGANVFLGREPRRLCLLDGPGIARGARAALAQVGADFGPEVLVRSLSIGRQQLVEIAKALAQDARILIMDEPTSSLSERETARLLALVRELRGRGVSVIYISHRLGEVEALADRVVVLRDGRVSGELARHDITRDALVRRMVGRDVVLAARRGHALGPKALEVQDLVVPGRSAPALTLAVRAGETVGLAGLVGAGRGALLRTLFGVTPARRGEVRVLGTAVRIARPCDAIRAGLALVPEDRQQQGLFLDMAVRDNVTMAGLARWRRLGFRDPRREARASRGIVERLRIRTPSDAQLVKLLSGGNQQKVVLARWLLLAPRVLLLAEPTRGVDVGARQEIYALLDELAAAGVAILFASSELEEVLTLSDRVLVMHEGRIAGELPRAQLSEEAVMRLATGSVARSA